MSSVAVILDNDSYHSDTTADSHSSLELFRQNVARYAGIRIHRNIKPGPPTQEMILGSAFHCAVFEPDRFKSRYAIAPKVDLRTRDGKASMAEFRNGTLGSKSMLTYDQAQACLAMAASVMTHCDALELMNAESLMPNESVIEWADEDTGLPLKAKIDKVTQYKIVVDLKTCSDASEREFAKSAATYGYHRQAALYLDGLAANGIQAAFAFVAVQTSEPYFVEVYELEEEDLDLGREENREKIIELARRKRDGDWSSIKKLSLPHWAKGKR